MMSDENSRLVRERTSSEALDKRFRDVRVDGRKLRAEAGSGSVSAGDRALGDQLALELTGSSRKQMSVLA